MRLILHYLWFDVRRWRTLFIVMWGLAMLHALLAWLEYRSLHHIDWGQSDSFDNRFADAAAVCRILMALCAAVLCVFAGRTDSPVRGRSWQRTRPGRGWRLAAAHILTVLAGAVLPAAAARAMELSILKFNAFTVWTEFLQMVILAAGFSVMLLSWAVLSPRPAGLCFGAFLATGAALCGLRVADWTSGPWPVLAVILVVLALPPLCGLRNVRRRGTTGNRMVTSVITGALLIPAIQMMPLVQKGVERLKGMGNMQREYFGGDEWRLVAKGGVRGSGRPAEYIQVKGETWSLDLAGTALPEAMESWGGSVSNLSWRSSADAAWSPPQAVWGSVTPAWKDGKHQEGIWNLSWSTDTGVVDATPAMQNGELRFDVKVNVHEAKSAQIPVEAGTFARDDGWTFEVLQKTDDAGGSNLRVVCRYPLLSSKQRVNFDLNALHRANDPRFEMWSPFTQSWLVIHTLPIPADFGVFYLVRNGSGAVQPRTAMPPAFEVTRLVREEFFDTTLHVTGVTFTPPALQTTPPVPTEKEAVTRRRTAVQPGRDFYPWLPPGTDSIPPPDAGEIEVATFLNRQKESAQAFSIFVYDYTPERQSRLSALVEKWLAMFVEMAVREPGSHGDFFRSALIEGTPESRRGEVLRRIPESAKLTEVAVARHWETDAKPWVLRLIESTGGIPNSLMGLCRQYRDPVFHPAMRKSFTADLPTIRYWESMPDLAAELPAKLSELRREYLARGGYLNAAEGIEVLLYSGDSAVLGETLRQWQRFYKPSKKASSYRPTHALLLEKYLRNERGEPVPFDNQHPDFTAGTTAADYTFDSVRHLFTRKPASSKP